MPYSGADDSSLPENVKKMPEADRKQWVAVFNAVMRKCLEDGDSQEACETSAFKQANGVIKAKHESLFSKKLYAALPHRALSGFVTTLKNLLNLPMSDLERAISIPDIYEQIQLKAQEVSEYAWVKDIFVEDTGMFAVIIADGKLYRCTITVTDTVVETGEWQEVETYFAPVEHTRTLVRRMDDGRYRFISLSGSAVLNRVGEIDATALFDSFVEHIEETGEYPIRQFYHAGQAFRTGVVDFVGREGFLLITSGIYDDTELGRREVSARLADPDYWGDSIGFLPIGGYEELEVGGVKIPMFTRGIFREVSTLPEAEAAAWFTATPTIREEVRRMIVQMDEKQMAAFIKLFDGNEEEAERWLKENAEARNRQIAEGDLIARDAGAGNVENQALPPPEPEPAEEEPPKDKLVLDEEMVDKIVEALVLNDAFVKLVEDLISKAASSAQSGEPGSVSVELNRRMGEIEAVLNQLRQLPERVEAIEAGRSEEERMIALDAPRRAHHIDVTYRPRKPTLESTSEDPIAAETAGVAEVLHRNPRYRG